MNAVWTSRDTQTTHHKRKAQSRPSRMDGLAAEYSPVFMGDLPDFIVRPLPHAGLAGAFRFHLTSKDLSTLGLNVGDLCQITSEDGSVGYGIAWRSTEPLAKPQSHPVRMSDSLRDAFGFKLGMHVAIIKAKTQIHEADQVSITEVRSDDEARNSSDNLWMYRCAIALGECIEASTMTLRPLLMTQAMGGQSHRASRMKYRQAKPKDAISLSKLTLQQTTVAHLHFITSMTTLR